MTYRSRTNWIIILCILIIAVLSYYVAWPNYQKLTDLSQQVAVEQNKTQQIETRLAGLRQLDSEVFVNQKAELDRLNLAVPDTAAMPEAMTQISKMVNDAGLSISALTPTVDQEKSGVLKISVSITGDFIKAKDFFGKLEKNIRPNKVVSLTILGQDDNTIVATADLEMPYNVTQKSKIKSQNNNGEGGQNE